MRLFLTILIVFCFISNGFATHNRAGEITYRQLSAYKFEVTVITFTNTKPTSDGTIPADRPELIVYWGDNTYNVVARNGYIDLPDFYRKNTYTYTHTYPGPGTYEIVVEDPNRNEGVENIPNSVTVVFSIKTILQINSLLGLNNTPILLNPPVDKAAVYRKFIHNPAAFDPDGDSISYKLTVCTGENGEPIENYQLPESSNKPISVDSVKGDLIWDAPIKEGIFNVAFFIEEWRKGIKIGQITRDMQIEVFDSDNLPPVIDSIPPYCVVAGDSLSFIVTARDSSGELITLSATGGVFEVANPANFLSKPTQGVAMGTFGWQTACNHIRKSSYQVVFKATDNNGEVNLVDQQTTEIKVLAPPPDNIQIQSNHNSAALSWNSYECTDAIGFNIYRSTAYFGFIPDACETGVPPYTGYELIATIPDVNAIQFIDDNNGQGLTQGYTYCYIITAVFEEGLEGKASAEYCAQLERGIPIITNVSVEEHGVNDGIIFLGWSKPLDFDTELFPGDLKYVIKRGIGMWPSEFYTIDTLFSMDDTTYFDEQLNTESSLYSYKVEIHNPQGLTLQPMTASSIYPELFGANNQLTIHFTGNTPWSNYLYTIYRNNSIGEFDSIGYTDSSAFVDKDVINEIEYCYQVKTEGAYDLPGIKIPIINYSHRNCGIPLDTVPPIKLELSVESNCETFINTLKWVPNAIDNDITKYYIYYTPDFNLDVSLIDSVLGPDTLIYYHIFSEFPSGCYVVTAIDENENESEYSNLVCVDNCALYELPNVFTPNSDNVNDLYIPLTPAYIIDRFIEKVDFKVYSRWGNLVYETDDPLLNWNGKQLNNDKLVTPGVYYYVCDIVEKRVSGKEERNIVGFIHVFHNNEKQLPE